MDYQVSFGNEYVDIQLGNVDDVQTFVLPRDTAQVILYLVHAWETEAEASYEAARRAQHLSLRIEELQKQLEASERFLRMEQEETVRLREQLRARIVEPTFGDLK